MAEEDLRQKEDFYKALDSTSDEDDDAPDPGRQSSIVAMQKFATSKGHTRRAATSLTRSASDSKVVPQTKQQQDAIHLDMSTKPSSSGGPPIPLKTRHTLPSVTGSRLISPSSNPHPNQKAVGKRKRQDEPQRVPGPQQILAGLVVYFFPNNDKHPARKARIAKAAEFGAVWSKEFTEDVTHVIVDKNTEYGLLLKFLKRETLPAGVIVVSEDYPAECISFRTLLDPNPLQFRVKGYAIPADPRIESSHSNAKFLREKPASKSSTAQQPFKRKAPLVDGAPSPISSEVEIKSTEELDAAIKQAKELKDVPLDQDDGTGSRPTSSEGPDTDDEAGRSGSQLLKTKNPKFQNFQDRFQCMQKHTGSKTETPNANTIAILQQMADYYGKVGDEWRLRGYRKAIATLRNHPTKVWTKEEALALPQIGGRLATKIEEIAFTNRLRRLENAKAEPSDQVFREFMQIYGVGFAQASKWVDAGYKTMDEVWEKAELTDNQRIGIQHYEDFNARIPRAEVAKHGGIVKEALQEIDPAFEVIVGGSYRRGSDTCGDIDCIITRPDTGSEFIRQVVFDQLVPKLSEQKFLVAELAATSRDDGSKWHGASKLPTSHPDAAPNPWRRIDFLLVPSDEIGAALIYFTGNDIFNRSLRLLAATKGMRLNQRGLYRDVIRGKGRQKLSDGALVEGKDEKKIFDILGVPWRPPEHRIC